MLQARAIERLGSSEYYDFWNKAALLEPMSADHWQSYSYDYTVESADNVKREHRKNMLIWLATSNGIREEEFCLRNVRIEELASTGRVAEETLRLTVE